MSQASDAARWWAHNIEDRASGQARGLAARLRRADALAVLAEPAVHDLARVLDLRASQADRLVRLVQVLAHVRGPDAQTLARRLGGTDPAMSPLRFQRLLRSDSADLPAALRRALAMVDRRCNVVALAHDLLAWDHPDRGDLVRRNWAFDYFATPRPDAPTPDAPAQDDAA